MTATPAEMNPEADLVLGSWRFFGGLWWFEVYVGSSLW